MKGEKCPICDVFGYFRSKIYGYNSLYLWDETTFFINKNCGKLNIALQINFDAMKKFRRANMYGVRIYIIKILDIYYLLSDYFVYYWIICRGNNAGRPRGDGSYTTGSGAEPTVNRGTPATVR